MPMIVAIPVLMSVIGLFLVLRGTSKRKKIYGLLVTILPSVPLLLMYLIAQSAGDVGAPWALIALITTIAISTFANAVVLALFYLSSRFRRH